jgi:hypothetical protein
MSKDSIRYAAGPEGGGDEDILVRAMLMWISIESRKVKG